MTEYKIDQQLFAKLKDKVAIITGGTSGIGRGTAELFVSHGAKVIAASIKPGDNPLPEGVFYQRCDVSVWADLKNAFAVAIDKYGSVDIVCANAGISDADRENLARDNLEEPCWDVIDVNLKGVLATVKAALYHFRRNTPKGGVLILTSSCVSYMPSHPGMYQYTAAKYGVLGLMRTMKNMTPEINTRINVVAPYLTITEMAKTKPGGFYEGQPITGPPEVARAIAALATDETLNGKALIAIAKKCYETEEVWERVLPMICGEDTVEAWSRALKVPFTVK